MCCVLSGIGFSDELITRPEKSLAHWGLLRQKTNASKSVPNNSSLQCATDTDISYIYVVYCNSVRTKETVKNVNELKCHKTL